jgi:hypothetical protein
MWASMWINAADGMNLLVSAACMALGVFVVAAPLRAVAIWGSKRFEKLAAPQRAAFILWYRAFGIVLCLTAILFALDTNALR